MEKIKTTLRKLIEEAGVLLKTSSKQELAFQKAHRWVERSEILLKKYFSAEEANKFKNTRGGIRMGDPWGNLHRMIKPKISFLEVLQEELEIHPDFWKEELNSDLNESNKNDYREGFFINGQYYEAQKIIRKMVLSAKKSIYLIDNYIDENVLDLLTDKESSVIVNILTRSIKPSLKAAAQAFNKQYGGMQVRTSNNFHDRFIIIDDLTLYHLGASIKDLGNLSFMFSLIEEKAIINMLTKKWNKEWKQATTIV
ncbi:MAG: hypothetical protein JSV30_01445 [Candidatus Omnitrophota bacterium]|nr:MAG: hypothetical protein JSV30_01445 [Candidatus Omnitrophota bacterium]